MKNRDIVNELINARVSNKVVIITGDCQVNYDGRAWSYTDGKHSVIINPNGSVMVHDSESVKPKNWQPKGANTKIALDEDNEIEIKSERSNPRELLIIRFTDVEDYMVYDPSGSNLEFEGSEKDMHKYIVNNPEIISKEFVPEKMEKSIKTGDIDVFGHINDEPTVIEVKRKKAQQSSVGQLHRYVECFDNASGVLVAPDITNPALETLQDNHGYQFIKLAPTEVVDK